ncbi:hypothetical protein HXX01_01900 [Candidatus Nomurabacteria bacterium]|nr:hypothetical protein [Candidatus Nomurabacteria bacterium]
MNYKTVIECDRDDLKQVFAEVTGELVKESILSKLEGIKLPTRTACELLGKSGTTIQSYVKRGLLVPMDRQSRNYQFDLRQLVEFIINKKSEV